MPDDPFKPPDAPMTSDDYAIEKPPAPGGRVVALGSIGVAVLLLYVEYRTYVDEDGYWLAPAIVAPSALLLGVSGLVHPGIFDAQRMFEDRLMGERIAMVMSVLVGAIASVVLLAFLDGAI